MVYEPVSEHLNASGNTKGHPRPPSGPPTGVAAIILLACIATWVLSTVGPISAKTQGPPDTPPRYVVETVIGNGEFGTSLDGKTATDGTRESIQALAIAPDGALFIAAAVYHPNLGLQKSRIHVLRNGLLENLPGPGLPAMAVTGIALDDTLLYVAGGEFPPSSRPLLLRYDLRSGETVDLFATSCHPPKWPNTCPQPPRDLAVLDHSVLFTTGGHKRVYAIDPDGSVFHYAVADGDLPNIGRGMNDGGAAQGAPFEGLTQIAAEPGGLKLLMPDSYYCRVRLVDGTGIIRTIAGSDGPPSPYGGFDSCRFEGDGGPAVEAGLDVPGSAAFGRRGEVLIGEHYRIRRVGTDGRIETVAGVGEESESCPPELCCSNEPTPALEAKLVNPTLLGVVDTAGSAYFVDGTCPGPRLRVLRPVEDRP